MEFIKIAGSILINLAYYSCLGLTILAAAIVVIGHFRQKRRDRPGDKSLEEMLAILERCGFRPAEPFGVEDMLQEHERSYFEKMDYGNILMWLAEKDEESGRPRCDNLVWFDTECIYDDEDYVEIAHELARITHGSIIISEARGRVGKKSIRTDNGIEVFEGTGEVWLEFVCDGERCHWDFQYNDDWVDMAVFEKFDGLLQEKAPDKAYVSWGLGQDFLMGCVTEEELATARKLKLRFQ